MRWVIDGAELPYFAEKEFSNVPGPKDKPVRKKKCRARGLIWGLLTLGHGLLTHSYILSVIVKLKLPKLFSTFNMDKPGKIGRLRWKERH